MAIGILGLGTVGGGVVNVLKKNKAEIESRCNQEIVISTAAVKTINRKRICSTENIKLTTDPFSIVNNDKIDIVLELIGGINPAKELIELAIKNNKHVITANKLLISTYGNELLNLAKKHNVHLLFEAAVAGGIPVLKSLEHGLSANKIELIMGIINGTTNFILTEMYNKNKSFDDALKEAKSLGYAEADPTFDIEGIDSAHKLTILTAIAFGCELQLNKIFTKGIDEIKKEDLVYADELGYIIKHLATAKKIANKIQMKVYPTLVPKESLLANVKGVMNAVLIKGNAVGDTLYYGPGAGDQATASAIIADLIDIKKNISNNDSLLVNNSLATPVNNDFDEIKSEFYIKLLVSDKPEILAKIKSIFTKNSIKIEKLTQKPINKENDFHIIIITNTVKIKDINKVVNEIKDTNLIKSNIDVMHVETLN
jgi:homoserine dehydrogenase